MAYYRIYLTKSNEVAIVEMGESDEIDYDQSRFLSSEKFEDEGEAIAYLLLNQHRLPHSVHNPYNDRMTGILD